MTKEIVDKFNKWNQSFEGRGQMMKNIVDGYRLAADIPLEMLEQLLAAEEATDNDALGEALLNSPLAQLIPPEELQSLVTDGKSGVCKYRTTLKHIVELRKQGVLTMPEFEDEKEAKKKNPK